MEFCAFVEEFQPEHAYYESDISVSKFLKVDARLLHPFSDPIIQVNIAKSKLQGSLIPKFVEKGAFSMIND